MRKGESESIIEITCHPQRLKSNIQFHWLLRVKSLAAPVCEELITICFFALAFASVFFSLLVVVFSKNVHLAVVDLPVRLGSSQTHTE
jgi:hypothetical protein